jgi:hypothetical protein
MSPINPYQSPSVPDPPLTPPARGVGVWRDGDQIVMHPQATLPRFCVVTGEPARFGYYLEIAWSYPLDVTTRTLALYVPLSAEVHQLCRSRRRMALGGFLAAALAAGLALYRSDLAGAGGICVALAILGVVGLVAFYVYVQYSQFLYFAGLDGEYFRLKGADRRFLDRLPDWSGQP